MRGRTSSTQVDCFLVPIFFSSSKRDKLFPKGTFEGGRGGGGTVVGPFNKKLFRRATQVNNVCKFFLFFLRVMRCKQEKTRRRIRRRRLDISYKFNMCVYMDGGAKKKHVIYNLILLFWEFYFIFVPHQGRSVAVG